MDWDKRHRNRELGLKQKKMGTLVPMNKLKYPIVERRKFISPCRFIVSTFGIDLYFHFCSSLFAHGFKNIQHINYHLVTLLLTCIKINADVLMRRRLHHFIKVVL